MTDRNLPRALAMIGLNCVLTITALIAIYVFGHPGMALSGLVLGLSFLANAFIILSFCLRRPMAERQVR